MSQQLYAVMPGDLITAAQWNSIINEIKSLATRVATLETSGPAGSAVTITGLSPAGSVAIGSQLTVVGKNFGVAGTAVVVIDGNPVTTFAASSDTLLTFTVPNIQGATTQGKVVTLLVSTAKGSASIPLVVVQAQPSVAHGTLFVTASTPPSAAPILAGQSYIWAFTVTAITDTSDTYTLAPSVTAAGWQAVAVDQNGNPLSPQAIVIPKSDPPNGSSQTVLVRVTIPAGTATGVASTLTLTVTSQSNPTGFTPGTGSTTITVGSAAPPAQKVNVSFDEAIAPATVHNGVVVISAANTLSVIDFNVQFPDTAQYSLAVAVTPSSAAWTPRIAGAATITPTPGQQTVVVATTVVAQAGAPQVNLVLTVSKSSDSTFFGNASQAIRLGP